MTTKAVFRPEHEPFGYGRKFAIDCRYDIKSQNGLILWDNNPRYAVGTFSNLRREGEVFVADVKMFEHAEIPEGELDFSISGHFLGFNENNEASHVRISCISVNRL